jgi:hypothetical protein
MGKSKGPCLESRLLITVICCLFMITLLSGIHAYDYAEILIPDHADWWMRPLDSEDDSARQDELCMWWGYDGEDIWSCPRCGARDNIALVDRCMQCGYARSNPEGYLLCPIGSACITNSFSNRHRAIDFGIPEGTSVFAADDGIVIGVLENDRWEGNVLKVRHGDGLETRYGHLLEILVPLDGYVRMGEVIALSGNTGASTGPHLHFEVYQDGEADNPLYYLGPWQ